MWILLKNEFNYSLVKIEKYKKDFYKMVTVTSVRTLKSFAMKTSVSSVCPGLPLFSLIKVR